MMKTCPDCRRTLPARAFSRNAARPDGLQFYCKECYSGRSARAYRERMRRRGRTVRERVVAPTGHKYCPGCQQSLPLDHWHRNAAVRDGLASYCKTCRRKQSRVGHLKSAFGLTPEEHQALLEQQGGRCVICGATPPTHTDHDHSTGAVRGLLCGPCNMGLGQFRDDPALLEAAADYLRERQPTDDVVRRRLHEIFPPAPAA